MKKLRQEIRRIIRSELGVINEGVEYNDAVASLGKVKKVLERMMPNHGVSIKKASTHTYAIAPTGVFLYVSPMMDKKRKAARVTYLDNNVGDPIFRVTILSDKDRDVFTNYRAGLVSKDFMTVGQAVSYIVNSI